MLLLLLQQYTTLELLSLFTFAVRVLHVHAFSILDLLFECNFLI